MGFFLLFVCVSIVSTAELLKKILMQCREEPPLSG